VTIINFQRNSQQNSHQLWARFQHTCLHLIVQFIWPTTHASGLSWINRSNLCTITRTPVLTHWGCVTETEIPANLSHCFDISLPFSVASTSLEVREDLWRARAYNGVLGVEPPTKFRGSRAPGHGGEAPWSWKRPTEAITFMSFAIFRKLGMPNLSYRISWQDLTKFDIWQTFSLPPHLKDTTALSRKSWGTLSRNLQLTNYCQLIIDNNLSIY